MEMQQTEIFPGRSFTKRVGSHLKLVQPVVTSEVFNRGRSSERVSASTAGKPVSRATGSPVDQARGHERGLRLIAPEHVERLLNDLRGEALLVGALCYDLGLRLSHLRFLRIRDVNLTARVIELSDGPKPIPAALYEDLRDHISEKVCGRGAGHAGQRRDQLLFSHEAFENVLRTCASSFAKLQIESNDDGASALRVSIVRPQSTVREPKSGDYRRVRDNFLRVMGWFHAKRASRRGGRIDSPLGLFDKGPKIVRRDRGGVVHSYYLWRAVYSR